MATKVEEADITLTAPDPVPVVSPEKAAGLVPFAIKLPQDLVASLHALAIERGVPMNQLAEALLRAGIGHEPPAPK